MNIVHSQRVSMTIPSGQQSGTGSLTGFNNADQMVVFASWSLPSDSTTFTSDRTFVDPVITNSSTLTASRISTAAEVVTIEAYVVEFDTDTNVYKGVFSMTSGGGTDDQTATANINGGSTMALNDVTKAFCWSYFTSDDTSSSDGRPQANCVVTRFDSTSVIGFERDYDNNAISGHWYVVESNTLSVQHVSTTLAIVDFTQTDTSFTSVSDLAETIILSSYTSSVGSFNDNGLADVYLTDESTLTFTRALNDTENLNGKAVTQIIEDTSIATQRGQFTAGATSDSTSLSTVDLTRTIALSTTYHPNRTYQNAWQAGHCDEYFCRLWISDSPLQINAASSAAPSARQLSWQTVEFSTGSTPTARRVMVVS